MGFNAYAKDPPHMTKQKPATPPLPGEIAALIERARGYPEGSFTELIDALRALAQENARLKGEGNYSPRIRKLENEIIRQKEELEAEFDVLTTRNWELEAERDAALKRADELYIDGIKQASDRLAERDAIQAKTIEECLAKLPEDTPAYVCAAIRALAQTDEATPQRDGRNASPGEG